MATPKRPNDVVLENVKVLDVTDGSEYFDDRIFIEVDGEFPKFDKDGNKTNGNTFGINARSALKQLAPFSNEIFIADAFGNGEPIKIAIYRLAVRFGTISIKREFKFKGEARADVPAVNGVPQTYQNDCWKTTITGFIPNMEMINKSGQLLQMLLQNPKDDKPKAAPSNPLNV